MAVVVSATALARAYPPSSLELCPGYKASNVKTSDTGLTADLTLAGPACNIYGTDLKNLILEVSYDTGECYISKATNYRSMGPLTELLA